MLVGEIRDTETVEISFRLALTGHFMFSILHKNSAIKTAPKLFDIGIAIEPYLVVFSVKRVMAQRFFKTKCKDCAETEKLQRLKKKFLKTKYGN